jgi:hypothetical protein
MRYKIMDDLAKGGKCTKYHESYKAAPHLFIPAGLSPDGERLYRLKDSNSAEESIHHPPGYVDSAAPHWHGFTPTEPLPLPLPFGFTEPFFGKYLEIVALKGSTDRAARESGYLPTVIDSLRKSLPSFDVAIEQALTEFVDRVRGALVDRALYGSAEPLIHHGKITGWVTKIDAAALSKVAITHVPEFKDGEPLVNNSATGVLLLPQKKTEEEWGK